jgi:hypothetical protein
VEIYLFSLPVWNFFLDFATFEPNDYHCSKALHFTAEYVFFLFWVRPPPNKNILFDYGHFPYRILLNMRKAYFPALATSPSSYGHFEEGTL